MQSLYFFIDGRWQRIGKALAQIDSGMTNTPWGVDPSDNIYAVQKGTLRKVGGKLMHVSSGESGVWGVSRNRYIYIRKGINLKRKTGRSWKRVGGRLSQIDSGPFGRVCGVTPSGSIYCRLGISRKRRYGTRWIRVPGALIYISCGLYGHWGVNKAHSIYFRHKVSRKKPQGTKWQRVPGKLVQIESGPDGAVWGVNIRGIVYTRRGITKQNPVGTAWKPVGKKPMASISVGTGFVYAIGRRGAPFSGDVAKFLGAAGIPRKPGQ